MYIQEGHKHLALINYQFHFSKPKKTQRPIKYIGAKIWNSIPILIKHYSFQKFKKAYKEFLITNLSS